MTTAIANVEMAKAWDGDEGDDWARDWQIYDRSVRVHHAAMMTAAAVRPGERVLDVGCGNGESTRDAARLNGGADALGVDLSSRMIERARELAAADGLGNARFERADAQVHAFPPASYDVVVSRFGWMFFADPVAAFSNIAQATGSGGRLALVAWRDLGANEWLREVLTALAAGRDLPAPPPGAPGPLGMADPGHVRAVLDAAGFADVSVDPVDGPLCFGGDADAAYSFFSGTGVARGMLGGVDEATRGRALDALRATLRAHETADGVVFSSGTWLVTARRP